MSDELTNSEPPEVLKRRPIAGGVAYIFFCRGCQQTHTYEVLWNGKGWKFNGDMKKPSFSPSLQYGDCHLFLVDGVIEYCGDSRHHLRGKKVPLEPF